MLIEFKTISKWCFVKVTLMSIIRSVVLTIAHNQLKLSIWSTWMNFAIAKGQCQYFNSQCSNNKRPTLSAKLSVSKVRVLPVLSGKFLFILISWIYFWQLYSNQHFDKISTQFVQQLHPVSISNVHNVCVDIKAFVWFEIWI